LSDYLTKTKQDEFRLCVLCVNSTVPMW